MIIGIDHGNSQIKTEHCTFIAGLTDHGTAQPPIPTDILCFNDQYYTLPSIRDVYKRDKTQNEKCFLLTLIALAKEVEAMGRYSKNPIDLTLAVGLPPEHYAKQKASFQKYFTDHGNFWNYTYNNKPYSFNLEKVFVFPQAYSAVAAHKSVLKEYPQTYIVDIGGYTVDVVLLKSGNPNLEHCQSIEMGTIVLSNQIIHRVNSEYSFKINDNHINAVLTDQKTTLTPELKEFIRQCAKEHSYAILDQLREIGIDLRIDPAIFIGGGSSLLRQYIYSSGLIQPEYTEFIPEISANAAGYTILARAALSQQKTVRA